MFTGSPLLAQESAGPKVGVFDGERVLAESEMGQEAVALLSQLQEQRVAELQAQQAEINTISQQALSAAPGTVEAAQLERQMEDRSLQYQRLEQDVQQELGQRQAELIEPITQMVRQIIDTMGREEGYVLIFNMAQSGLVYFDATIEVTEEIIRRINVVNAGSQ
jgi:outer membrane protein